MAVIKQFVTVTFIDESNRKRQRVVDVPDFLDVDSLALRLDQISKSGVQSVIKSTKEKDVAWSPAAAGSEVNDTLRLYFELDNLDIASFDVPDAKDEVFISTSGDGQNILKPLADFGASTAETALAALIAGVLAGDTPISDGETPSRFLRGLRL